MGRARHGAAGARHICRDQDAETWKLGESKGIPNHAECGDGVRSCFLISSFPAQQFCSLWRNGVRLARRSSAESSHVTDEPGRWSRFDQEMVMITHEAVRMTNPMIPLNKIPEEI